jgi:hypothetical protein
VADPAPFHRNLNIFSWEGDGKQRRFVVDVSDARAPESIGSVLEDAGRWPVGRFGVDTGFRWSYDGTALIVDESQAPPAEGVIISCSYEPEVMSITFEGAPVGLVIDTITAVRDALEEEEAKNG